MKYLLDTNVVSALRLRGRNPEVEGWAAEVPVASQFIAATTVTEIERGVISRERTDPSQDALLRAWFERQVLPAFANRILPFDFAAVRILAGYRIPEHAPFEDVLIASIAEANAMTVVTRNTKHFEPLGVVCLNPWDAA